MSVHEDYNQLNSVNKYVTENDALLRFEAT